RHLAGQSEAAVASDVAALQKHPPLGRRQLTGKQPEQGALARAVRSDQPYDLSRVETERHRGESGPMPVAVLCPVARSEVVDLQRHGVTAIGPRRERLSSHRKNGPPVRAVTMPTGTSTGAITVRANR